MLEVGIKVSNCIWEQEYFDIFFCDFSEPFRKYQIGSWQKYWTLSSDIRIPFRLVYSVRGYPIGNS